MNKTTITLKVDDYTIILHRGEEESKEIAQKRLARYITCLHNIAMKLMVKYFEEYYPKLKTDVENIIQKHIPKKYSWLQQYCRCISIF